MLTSERRVWKKKTRAFIGTFLIIVAVGLGITLTYAYEYNYLGSFGVSGSGCPLNPYHGNCMGIASANGTVVSTNSSAVSGWFFGMGTQSLENVTVYVPAMGVNFTQGILGCGSGRFRVGRRFQ